MIRTRFLTVAVACGAAIVLTACNDTEGAPVSEPDQSLTRPEAQQRVVEQLTRTLMALPQDTLFTRIDATNPSGGLSAGAVLPCDEANQGVGGPASYNVSYYVEPLGGGNEQYDAIVKAWESFGWTTRQTADDPTPSHAADVADGYTFSVKRNKFGSVSVGGNSPCFPRPAVTDAPDAPETIPHP